MEGLISPTHWIWGEGKGLSPTKLGQFMFAAQANAHIDPVLTHRSQRSSGDLQVSVGKPAVGAGSPERQNVVILLGNLLGVRQMR